MQHLILIGFKNTGKSTVGLALAKKLKLPFVDLDDQIQIRHQENTGEKISCREIMKLHGEKHFRTLEHRALKEILEQTEPMVIAVGGGTPMKKENQKLLQKHKIIHISAPKSIVFERIMINGKPAFFAKDKEPFANFEELWSERSPIFEKLAQITIDNGTSIESAVKTIEQQLIKKTKK